MSDAKVKVLVFTSIDKWVNLPSEIRQKVSKKTWDSAYPRRDANTVVECGFSNSKAVLNVLSLDNLKNKEGVFLIYDGVEPKKPFLDELKKQCEGDDLYVLVHTHGPNLDDFKDWTLSGLLPGSHTGLPEDHYSPLFEILTDDRSYKLNSIINTIFKPYNKMDAILLFLQGCLVPNNNDDSFVFAYKKLLDYNDLKGVVEDFYENTYLKQPEDYIGKLAELRKKLLPVVE